MNASVIVAAAISALALGFFLLHRLDRVAAARRNRRLALRSRMTAEEFLARCSHPEALSPELVDWLRSTVARLADIPDPETIYPSDRFCRDLGPMGFDDVGIVELIMAVEERFGLDIPDRDCEGFVTVEDLAAYVAQRRDRRGGCDRLLSSRESHSTAEPR